MTPAFTALDPKSNGYSPFFLKEYEQTKISNFLPIPSN
jgi:hypothetical protein